MDALHYNNRTELDTHSLFGTMQVKSTHDFFINHKMRPFILSQSSYAGMGKFGSTNLGDNYSEEDYMA